MFNSNTVLLCSLTFQFADDDLKDDDFEHNRVLLYPLLIAAATVVALIIIIVAVWQRYHYTHYIKGGSSFQG